MLLLLHGFYIMIPMPRPVDAIFKDWAGFTRGRFSKRYSYGRTDMKLKMAAMLCRIVS